MQVHPSGSALKYIKLLFMMESKYNAAFGSTTAEGLHDGLSDVRQINWSTRASPTLDTRGTKPLCRQQALDPVAVIMMRLSAGTQTDSGRRLGGKGGGRHREFRRLYFPLLF